MVAALRESCFGDGPGGGVMMVITYDVLGPKLDGRLLPQYDAFIRCNAKAYVTTLPMVLHFTGHIKPTPWVCTWYK